MKTMSTNNKQESGYILVGILIITAIALLIGSGLMQSASTSSSTRYVVRKDSENFYNVESSINKVTAWLQSNSQNMVTAFTAANFETNFELSDPDSGDNQGTSFVVPTMTKMKNTNHAVQLTNNSFFGTSAFPNTTNISTGTAFNAVNSFEGTDFGNGVNVRILMVWALETAGNYQPIFRIDAVTGSDPERGVHGINFVKSSLVTGNGGPGYYSQSGDLETGSPNNQCWSYEYSWNAGSSTWNKGAARSNCILTSRDDILLKSAIHGDVSTMKNSGITFNGGSASGTVCQGNDCNVTYTLPVNPTWTARCGGVTAVDVTAGAGVTDISAGATLADQCYRTVSIGSNKTIRFVTPDTPYHIKTLDPQNNSNSRITFQDIQPNQKYIIYLDSITGDKINGNQLVATNLAPHQLEIYITKDGSLTLDGTAVMNAVITGTTNHTINLLGNFTFNGALRSNAISVTGNAVLGYDEALGGAPALQDLNFTLFKASQRYR